MKKLFGRKIGMTQLFDTNGKAITCTIIQAQPNLVLENKPNNSIKIGYGETKENKLNKPEVGVFKKIGVNVRKNIRTLSNVEGNYKPGDEFGVEIFKPGEYVDVQGITKGHGYTGAIKRWNFKIGCLSHGHGYPHRWQGSLAFGRGGNAPQRVYKGKKMHGRYGHETVTIQNLNVVTIFPEQNLILIKGAIPGPEGSLVVIKTSFKKANQFETFNIITKEIQKTIESLNLSFEDKDFAKVVNDEVEKEQIIEETKKEIEKEENK